MNSKPSFFFHLSNDLKTLFQHVENEVKVLRPFEKIWIVVPSLALKNQLEQKIAQKLGICMGIELMMVQPAIQKLIRLFYEQDTSVSHVNLALKIHSTILSHIDLPEFSILKEYLKRPNSLEIDIDKLTALGDRLASDFVTYSLYVPHLRAEFEKRLSGHWQAALWKLIFDQHNFNSDPYQIIQSPIQAKVRPFKILFVNPSFMPKVYVNLLKALEGKLQISFLQLSFCAYYWGDSHTDFEKASLIHKLKKLKKPSDEIEQLRGYLADTNPLLSNFGKLGKCFSSHLELLDGEIQESYVASQKASQIVQYQDWIDESKMRLIDRPLNLLWALKADLLLMRSEKSRIALPCCSSIQVHQASTYIREIEVLYQNLIQMMHENPTIKPSDITVYAADIENYIPIIEEIFNNGESPLSAIVYDRSFGVQNKPLKALFSLIEFLKSSFDQAKLFELFYQSAFRAFFNLTPEMVEKWQNWIETLGPMQGYDLSEQNKYYKNQYEFEQLPNLRASLSFREGIDALLKYFLVANEESEQYRLGEFSTEGDELSQLIDVMTQLKEDQRALSENERPFSEWSQWLLNLLERYFRFDSDDEKKYEAVCQCIENFKNTFLSANNDSYSFETFYYYLEKELLDFSSSYGFNQLESVAFYSLYHCSPASSKVSCVLGLNDQVFPRTPSKSPVSLMGQFETEDYCPQNVDYDRYLFLQILLASDEFFIMSYLGYCTETFKQVGPSLLISELLSYIDKYFSFENNKPSESLVSVHPHLNFNCAYFSKPNFNKLSYSLAKKYYGPKKSITSNADKLLDTSNYLASSIIEKTFLNLLDLVQLAKDPIELHLKKQHKIYYNTFKLEHEHQQFVQSPLQKAMQDKNIFNDQVELNPDFLPKGVFNQLAKTDWEEKKQQLSAFLKEHHVSSQDFFTVELRSDVNQAYKFNEKVWVCPAVEIQLGSNRVVEIVGVLENVSYQGLFSKGADQISNTLSELPRYLIYCCLQEVLPLKNVPMWFFGKSQRSKSFLTSDPKKMLSKYIELYCLNINHPLPFLATWVPLFLDKTPEQIIHQIKADIDSEHFYHPYTEKMMRQTQLQPQLVEQWRHLAHELFNDLYQWVKS